MAWNFIHGSYWKRRNYMIGRWHSHSKSEKGTVNNSYGCSLKKPLEVNSNSLGSNTVTMSSVLLMNRLLKLQRNNWNCHCQSAVSSTILKGLNYSLRSPFSCYSLKVQGDFYHLQAMAKKEHTNCWWELVFIDECFGWMSSYQTFISPQNAMSSFSAAIYCQ